MLAVNENKDVFYTSSRGVTNFNIVVSNIFDLSSGECSRMKSALRRQSTFPPLP